MTLAIYRFKCKQNLKNLYDLLPRQFIIHWFSHCQISIQTLSPVFEPIVVSIYYHICNIPQQNIFVNLLNRLMQRKSWNLQKVPLAIRKDCQGNNCIKETLSINIFPFFLLNKLSDLQKLLKSGIFYNVKFQQGGNLTKNNL